MRPSRLCRSTTYGRDRAIFYHFLIVSLPINYTLRRHAVVVRWSKSALATLSVSGGLAVLVAIALLPVYAGVAVALGSAASWCWWLEHHPTI
jgi:hypothetical protein